MPNDSTREVAPVSDVTIEYADVAHLDKIVYLANSYRLTKYTPTEAGRYGFLVSSYERGEYQDLLVRAEHFYVAKTNGEVAGFIVAYGNDRVRPDEWLNNQLRQKYDDLVIIKQVCVSKDYASQGIGTLLYHHVLSRCAYSTVAAAVVTDPENTRSMSFHRKLGFEPGPYMTPPDGIPRVAWVKSSLRPEILIEQYESAVDLYRHEDILNWSKLRNFLYITTALIAALGVSYSSMTGGQATKMAGNLTQIVSLVGFCVAAVFAVTIWAGTRYLDARKEAVYRLEKVLAKAGGAMIVTPSETSPNKGMMHQSPTRLVLRFIPILAMCVWITVFIALTFF